MFEPFLLTIKYSRTSHCLASGLLESTWSHQIWCSYPILWLTGDSNVCSLALWVLARSWYIKFETLAVEYLIIIESWRCLIKPNILSWEYFVIWSTTFLMPIYSSIFEIILNFFICSNHIFHTLKQWILAKFRIVSAGFSFSFWIKNSYIWVSFF